MPRPQFTIRVLLVAMLAAACFFGGIRFERERQRWEDASKEIEPLEPGVIKLERPFTRVYPVEGADGEMKWVMEPPPGMSDFKSGERGNGGRTNWQPAPKPRGGRSTATYNLAGCNVLY